MATMAQLEQQQQQMTQQMTQQAITELTGHRPNVDSLFANGFLPSIQGAGVGVSPGVNGNGVYCPADQQQQQQQQQQMTLPSMSVSQPAPPLYVPTTHPSHGLINPSPVAAAYPGPQQPAVANGSWSLGGDNRQYGGTGYSSPLPAWPRPEHGYGDSVPRQTPSLSPLTSYMRPDVASWGGYGQAVSSFTPQFQRTTGTCLVIRSEIIATTR